LASEGKGAPKDDVVKVKSKKMFEMLSQDCFFGVQYT
jgi:hypothetical protein